MDMFLITDVARPRIDIGHFDSVATAFDTLASTCASTHTDAAAVVSAVMTDNDGPAARAFRERMLSGGDALVNHLRELAPASTDTTEAYRSVVRTVGPKVESMRTIAQDRGRELALLIQGQADPARITPLIEQTRTDLSQLEQSAVAAITAAFDAVTLPHPLEVDHAVENGVLDAGGSRATGNPTSSPTTSVRRSCRKSRTSMPVSTAFPLSRSTSNPLRATGKAGSPTAATTTG